MKQYFIELRKLLRRPSSSDQAIQKAFRDLIDAAELCLDNNHWEVRAGSGDLTDAIAKAKKLLSSHGISSSVAENKKDLGEKEP